MSELRQQCLWEFVSKPTVAAQALAGEHKADVCVIGGGITGLSAAIHLLEQGKSVILLEAWKIGHGGSGATSAWSTPAPGSAPMMSRQLSACSRAAA